MIKTTYTDSIINGTYVITSRHEMPIEVSKMKPRKAKKAWKKFIQKLAQQ